MIRNFFKYIVTEIKTFLKCLVSKGVSFLIHKLINYVSGLLTKLTLNVRANIINQMYMYI